MSDVRELGEFGLIARFARNIAANAGVTAGVGDDCAVVRMGTQDLFLTCDAALEGVHFTRETAAPGDIGWRTAAAALSDIAAMGGKPLFVLVTLAAPSGSDAQWLERLFAGLNEAVEATGAVVVGGDTTRSDTGVVIDVMALGEPADFRYLLRKGAHPGDVLMVTGWPGQAAAGLAALRDGAYAPELAAAHLRPTPRIAEGQWLTGWPTTHAMIDLSDGLVQDAGHLADASACGVGIESSRVPVSEALTAFCGRVGNDPRRLALTGGEDYELAFAAAPEMAHALTDEFGRIFNLPATIVGRFTNEWHGVRVDGKPFSGGGWDHFA